MDAYDVIEELSKEYGSHLLLAAYIKREQKCSASVACDRAYELDRIFESQLPDTYAEIEYEDFDNPEAIDGARFDDMNYLRYTER